MLLYDYDRRQWFRYGATECLFGYPSVALSVEGPILHDFRPLCRSFYFLYCLSFSRWNTARFSISPRSLLVHLCHCCFMDCSVSVLVRILCLSEGQEAAYALHLFFMHVRMLKSFAFALYSLTICKIDGTTKRKIFMQPSLDQVWLKVRKSTVFFYTRIKQEHFRSGITTNTIKCIFKLNCVDPVCGISAPRGLFPALRKTSTFQRLLSFWLTFVKFPKTFPGVKGIQEEYVVKSQ